MIIEAEIISRPYSGQFDEKIYDYENPWNSEYWTFVKFTNQDYTEWCGQFRGFPRNTAISTLYNTILILTSNYLFQIDRLSGELMEIVSQPEYQNLISSPDGSYILADYYDVTKIFESIKKEVFIDSPIQMDFIQFKNWENGKLKFTCDEFMNWNRHLLMTYDYQTDKIEILKSIIS